MGFLSVIFDLLAAPLFYLYQIVSEFAGWLKLHDFSGKKRRQHVFDDAPRSFAHDHLPAVIAASEEHTLLYREDGYILQNRRTKNSTPVPAKFRRRFIRKGIKALETLAPKN